MSPYENLPPRAFWKTGVAGRPAGDPGDLYRPRFPIARKDRVVTAGSCFAQHVGRTLKSAGFNVLDAEPLPASMPQPVAQRHGYGLYSARYGNIYTARQLRQLSEEAAGRALACPVWEKGGRFYDAQRPNADPEGLESGASVLRHRAHHLARVHEVFGQADVFVFTFGLTETWEHISSGTVYPTAPGTIAGTFDREVFGFRNLDYAETLADFRAFRADMKRRNPEMRFLVTVSPVPLTATATEDHVEVATCHSKSVLRAVCGTLVRDHDDIDYFPSYEVITSQTARGGNYEDNMRNVAPHGVETAMRLFLSAHGVAWPASKPPEKKAKGQKRRKKSNRAGEVCEEALLEAFAK